MLSRQHLGLALICLFAFLTAQVSLGANINYRNAVLADGATAYYEFDTGTPIDTAGGDNNATIQGTVTTGAVSATAGLGNAYSFAGAGAVRIPDAANFDLGNGAFTVELWYNTDSDGRGDMFTYKGGGGDFGVHSNSQGDPPGFTGGTSVYFNNYISDPGAGANTQQWHHVAATRASDGTFKIYTDGVARVTGTNTDSITITNDLLIGSNHNGTPDSLALSFSGRIDEVAWYPSALTQAQINNHIALAVPEPSTLVLFGLSTLGMLAFGRRARAARYLRG